MAADLGEASDGRIGEIEMIAEYFAPLAADTPGSLGLRDDAAILTGDGGRTIVTMDALIAGVHFFPDDAPEDIAWKALAVNVSDLVAKGARPRAYMLALALPGQPTRGWIAAFADGLGQAQRAFGLGLLGGDTTSTPGPLAIAVTAFGETPHWRDAPRRDGARPGDGVYLSGALGDGALGLKARRGDLPGLAAEHQAHLIDRYLRPAPRVALAGAVFAHASASMDISDGLAIDLGRLCQASGCGARVEIARLPLSDAARGALAIEPGLIETILTGGDDYEILACVPERADAAFVEAAARVNVAVTRIGRIVAGDAVEIAGAGGAPLVLSAPGYQHFVSPPPR
ncbi:MAG: thiamine-phosphate kinase [Hyphomicrobiales bacterium]|nr:thiamine-phosphate kinase [Hyphomicrobiales bacterium]